MRTFSRFHGCIMVALTGREIGFVEIKQIDIHAH